MALKESNLSKGSAPAAPDYTSAALAQGQANINAARVGAALNRVNQVTPYGSVTYIPPGGGSTPSYYGGGTSNQRAATGQGVIGGPLTNGPVGGSGMPVPQNTGSYPSVSNPGGLGSVAPSAATYQPGGGIYGTPSGGYGAYSSYGSASGYNPADDQWTQVTQLSPQQQQLYNTNVGNQQRAGTTAGRINLGNGQIDTSALRPYGSVPSTSSFQGVDTSGVTPLPSNLDANRQQVQDALYKSQTQYLDPQYAQGQKALDTQLINQGLRPGDEAYTTAESNFGLQKQQAYGNAQNQAITGATSQQAQELASALATRQQQLGQAFDTANLNNQNATALYGEQQSNASLADQQRTQQLQEQVTGQQLPLQQFLSLYGAGMGNTSQGVNAGSVPGATTPQAPDLLGATNSQYGAALNSANFENAQSAQTTGTITSLAAIAAMYF